MIYILALSLIVLMAISFFISNYDIISPWFISCAMYIISISFVILNGENWDISISPVTVVVIIIALLAFGLGEIIAKYSFKKDYKTGKITSEKEKIILPSKVNFVIYIFSILISVWYFLEIKEIAIQVGYNRGENLLIQYARLGMLTKDISINYILAIGTFILRALSYVYTFIFLYNKLLCRKEKKFKDFKLLLPTLCYLIQYSLSGSRGAIIEYIAYFLAIYTIFKMKTTENKAKNNIRILKYSVIVLLIFFVVFILLGSLKGWKIYEAKDMISLYSGGSILALDKYLMSNNTINYVFGNESLIGINHILYVIGIYPEDSTRMVDFINIGVGYDTNIYTSLKRYIQDFGYIGMIIVQFCFGFIFNLLYMTIIRMKKISYLYILYSILFMALVYQSIDDQFLVSFLSVTQISTIGFSFILYNILCKNRMYETKIM